MTVTREQVAEALFSLLTNSAAYAYSSRRFQTWDTIQSVQKPALFMIEHNEHHIKQKLITPAVRTLDVDVYLFIASGLDPHATPITDLNNLVDAIDPTSGGVLAPGLDGRQTLGGLVTDCYLEGEIIKVPGDLDGQGVAILPIKVVYM